MRELEERIGADEWDDWITFHNQYDFPDGFLVTEVLYAAIQHAIGGTVRPGEVVSYYSRESTVKPESTIKHAFAMAKSYVNSKRKSQGARRPVKKAQDQGGGQGSARRP